MTALAPKYCLYDKCGVEIVKDQFCVETPDQFAKRYNESYCRSKCKRLHGPQKTERGRPTLPDSIPMSSFVGEGIVLRPQPKGKTPRDAAYLDFVRTFDCVGCGWPAHMNKIEAHHIETGGTSIKCSDYLAVPLCAADARGCHAAADKSPESADGFKPYAAMLNKLWIKAGHKMKKGGE